MITYVIKSVEDFEIFYNYYQSRSLSWGANGRPVFNTLTIHTPIPYTLCLTEVRDGYHVSYYRGTPNYNGIDSPVSPLPRVLTATEVFERFLKHHRKHSSYLRQGGRAFTDPLKPYEFVSAMNAWYSTKEGTTYWAALRDKWDTLCRELSIE